MDPKPLPAHPSLEQYKKQAKELLKVMPRSRCRGDSPRKSKPSAF